ncbi:hypothetical protein ACR9GP_05870 [Enterobacter ludwigii]
MADDIKFNPYKTYGSPTDMFNVESNGLVQGDAQDDPAIRLQLSSGTWDGAEPTWAGVGAMECIAAANKNLAGANVKAPTAAVCNAFIVINQAYHGITTPGNSVPLFIRGGSVHYYRIGSGARIPLPVSAEVAALATGDEAVGADGFVWDLTNKVIDIYSSATSGNPKVNISLLMISPSGNNLTVKKAADGTVAWEDNKPCGLFLI